MLSTTGGPCAQCGTARRGGNDRFAFADREFFLLRTTRVIPNITEVQRLGRKEHHYRDGRPTGFYYDASHSKASAMAD